jgi:hypothetical protein
VADVFGFPLAAHCKFLLALLAETTGRNKGVLLARISPEPEIVIDARGAGDSAGLDKRVERRCTSHVVLTIPINEAGRGLLNGAAGSSFSANGQEVTAGLKANDANAARVV